MRITDQIKETKNFLSIFLAIISVVKRRFLAIVNHRKIDTYLGRQTHSDAIYLGEAGIKNTWMESNHSNVDLISSCLTACLLLRVLHYLISGGRSNRTINDRSFKSVYLQSSVRRPVHMKRNVTRLAPD